MAEATVKTLRDVMRIAGESLASQDEIDAWESDHARQQREELIQLSGIGEVLGLGGADVVVADRCLETKALCFVRQWLASRRPMLILFGSKGLGKTVAAGWALSRMAGRYIEAQALCTMRRDHFGGPSEAYERALRSGLLVVDELGAEANVSDALATLHDVVNRRQRMPRRTLLMGNLDRASFLARYDERTVDRLREIAVVRRVKGESMRRGAL